MQLIVLGMHRSGTSMLTGLTSMAGEYVGPDHLMFGPDGENPRGYWERRDTVAANEALLRLRGCTWNMVADWSLARPPVPPREIAEAMRSIVLDLDAFRPWVMKDPRLCLTLPYWTPLLEAPVAVLLYRDPLEIARSLERRGMPTGLSLSLWEYHAVGALNTSLGMPRVFVHHDRVIADPVGSVSRLLFDLEAQGAGMRGLSMPPEREIVAFVETSLYRARTGGPGAEPQLTAAQQAVAAMLRGELPQGETLGVSAASVEVMARAEAT
jgi:hypothetical protein